MKYKSSSYIIKLLLAVLPVCLPTLSYGQGLPEGENRDKVILACSACHGLDHIFNPSNEMSAEDWEFYVYDMVARGAPVRIEDMQDIIEYLVENFTTK